MVLHQRASKYPTNLPRGYRIGDAKADEAKASMEDALILRSPESRPSRYYLRAGDGGARSLRASPRVCEIQQSSRRKSIVAEAGEVRASRNR